jgi:hypothetical protein
MINPTMKENFNVRCTRLWKRKERQEEKVNKEQVLEIIEFAIV